MYFDASLFDIRPKANEGAVIRGDRYRFTVLTDRLIRMEYDESGAFEDHATKLAICRDFPVPEFTVSRKPGKLVIETKALLLEYDEKPFGVGLTILIKQMEKHKFARWHFGMKELTIFDKPVNLGGTTRTLDRADGRVPVENGLMSIHGFTVVDDSDSLLLQEDGWYAPRDHKETDVYFFGYRWDFKGTLRDYFRLTGSTPMIPRFALGNWWSRYYKYTEETYLDLMEQFRKRNIPLSVAVIDMDWHPVAIDPKYGNGWTGYSWNRDFFPDPKRFLGKLHAEGLKVTMNLHPADGVRAYEDRYEAFARFMGMDPEKGDPVTFDAADPKQFLGLFREVLDPLEEDGVDFWWLDWQQEGGTSDERFDPLWMLNHVFYLQNARKGTYPLAFSRYGGLGSHRYPIGFSGDTVMSWESLEFQPEFTATAANAGYGWWSHDIGGHMKGIWDNELQVRWLQYGVFSPIMRLHSAKNTFLLKEPWNFPPEIEAVFTDYLRLRHRLVPYLYTMNERTHTQGIPPALPLYYEYEKKQAPAEDRLFYAYKNEYLFGSELLVCPIVSPSDRATLCGKVRAWIPQGDWFDFFTGRHYCGEKELDLYRSRENYPVLAPAGAIVPLSDDPTCFGTPLPTAMELRVFAGKDGEFRLYEDNEQLNDLRSCTTDYTFHWGPEAVLTVESAEGDVSLLPDRRTYRVTMIGVEKPECVSVLVSGKKQEAAFSFDEKRGILSISIEPVPVTERIEVFVRASGKLFRADWKQDLLDLLPRWQTKIRLKQRIQDALVASASKCAFLADMVSLLAEEPAVLGQITEIVSANE